MAKIFRRPRLRYYYARFQVGGKDHCISTGKQKKSEAADEMERQIAKAKGKLSLDKHFKTLLELIDQMPPEDQEAKRQRFGYTLLQGMSGKLPLSEVWNAWLTNPKKRNPSQRTIEGYRTQWRRFETWAGNKKVQYIHEVSPVMVEDYATDLWESHVAPGTFNAHIKFLRSMFNTLKMKAGLMSNPWNEIPLMELERESRRDLRPEELAKVCGTAKGSLRYMFGLALYTGMRLSDCIHLRWKEVDFKQRIIEHMPSKTRRKNKKVRLPIHWVLEALLKELRATSKGEYLFPEEKATYEKDAGAVSKRIQQYFEACGIQTNEKSTNGHRRKAIVRVGFHSLRHSFVSLCAESRVPQVAIMELVGHGSPAMTALYSHAGDELKAKAIAALPAIAFKNGEGEAADKGKCK